MIHRVPRLQPVQPYLITAGHDKPPEETFIYSRTGTDIPRKMYIIKCDILLSSGRADNFQVGKRDCRIATPGEPPKYKRDDREKWGMGYEIAAAIAWLRPFNAGTSAMTRKQAVSLAGI